MARPRTLFLYTENYVYGGLERFVFDALSLSDPAWRVVVLHNDYPGFAGRLDSRVRRPHERRVVRIATKPVLKQALTPLVGAPLARAAAKALSLAGGAMRGWNERRIAAALAEFSPKADDVMLIVNGGYPGGDSCAAAAAAARRLGIGRVLYSMLSVHNPSLAPRIDKAAERRLISDVDFFVANTDAGRASLERFRGFPAAKLARVWTAVGEPGAERAAVEAARRRWSPDGAPLAGCIGQLYSLKGHRYAIEAWPEVRRRVPGARLVIIGEGELKEELRTLAAGLGVSDSVVFEGYFKGDAINAIAAFDLLVHPSSENEGLPYAIIEAMSLGKPAIGTRLGGVAEAIADGVTGLLVEPARADQLAEAVSSVLGNPERAAAFGAAARARQQENFRLEVMGRRLSDLYERPGVAGAPR